MAEIKVNRWALKHYKPLTEETMSALMDEIEAHIVGTKSKAVFSSLSEIYALASRFKGIVYKHPYIKKKHERILRSIIDRCGEAYYEKDLNKLYISKEIVEEWMEIFRIPSERMREYLRPLQHTRILEPSDKPEYSYKINSNFFQIVGPAAQYFVIPVDTEKFAGMTAVASGLTSIFVITHTIKSRKYAEEGLLIPSFLRLAMTYTISGLDPGRMQIEDVLEIGRINVVDNYFVIEKRYPSELWRSIRMEAFDLMFDNIIIEGQTSEGYKLNKLWVKMHEEGVKRYVRRIRERHEKRYRGF